MHDLWGPYRKISVMPALKRTRFFRKISLARYSVSFLVEIFVIFPVMSLVLRESKRVTYSQIVDSCSASFSLSLSL